MRKHNEFSPPTFGASSLLVIFSVLCLVVLALLCLNTAQAERRLSEASARGVADYYAADCATEEIFARLRSGEMPEGVAEEDGVYSFSCPISAGGRIEAAVERTEAGWRVLRWQSVAPEREYEDSAQLWNGGSAD